MKPEILYCDFFTGWVPAYCIFNMHLDSIVSLLRAPATSYEHDHTAEELAFIGVVSYTEAFFKDHFASILNLVPQKVAKLKERGRNVAIDATDLLSLDHPLHNKFGFLLSERFDFGTPKSINALYHDLLLITPFSKKEAAAFDRIIGTRNLLVHHGGIFTARFNRSIPEGERARTFADAVVITKAQVSEAAILVNEVAAATVQATISKLTVELNDIEASDVRKEALTMMGGMLDESVSLSADLRELSAAKEHAQHAQ